MKKAIWAMLNETEKALLREAEPAALGALDEDELSELHTRVRRARTKYTTLYRRRAGAQVAKSARRSAAHPQHERTLVKAEAFEDALARVSTALARAARQSAKELREERLAAAQKTARAQAAVAPRTARKAKTTGNKQHQTPIRKRTRAAARASQQRTEVRRAAAQR
jgi:hypothetical protein